MLSPWWLPLGLAALAAVVAGAGARRLRQERRHVRRAAEALRSP